MQYVHVGGILIQAPLLVTFFEQEPVLHGRVHVLGGNVRLLLQVTRVKTPRQPPIVHCIEADNFVLIVTVIHDPYQSKLFLIIQAYALHGSQFGFAQRGQQHRR